MKKSKVYRKAVNQMRAMGDVPWPARRFTYPPTFSNVIGATPTTHIGHCKRVLGQTKISRGRLRRKKTVDVRCGGKVFVRRGSLGKRRVFCEDCRARKNQRLQQLRLERRLQQRFGVATPSAAAVQERSSRLARFRRGR